MAKALKTIGMIAGAVALIATGVGAVGGAAFAASALGGTVASIATYAGLAAGVAGIGSQLLYKPPSSARGSVTQTLVAVDPPMPYVMGEGYVAGVVRYQRSYGATLKKIPNPYRWRVEVYSGGGPVHSLTPWIDQAESSSWYNGYLTTGTKLGHCPDTALAPNWAGAPNWDSSSKLSGLAAIGWNLLFDKEAKIYAAGMPTLGAFGKWVLAYDPRKDSTFPGGSGSHRLGIETSYEWTESPALHAGTYAYGRYQNGKRVMGVGLSAEGIDWASVAAWANVCEANDWAIFGRIFEPQPETRWPNLKEICAAGGARPIVVNGVLSFHYSAPRVALDTFTEADLAEGPGSVTAMKGRRERPNTITPKYIDPDQNWELVALAVPVSDSGYVSDDGEERKVEWPFNLVKDKDQAAELAAYVLTDARELQPITLSCGVRVRDYKPGECVHLDVPSLALDTDAIILGKEYDHASMVTTFTFIGETPAKHDFALGRTGTAPPTPGLKQTGQERDEAANAAQKPYGWQVAIIRTAVVKNPRNTSDVPQPSLLRAVDAGASASVTINRHDWDYPDGTTDVTRELGTVTGLNFETDYYVYFDDPDLTDTAPTYHATTDAVEALNTSDHPDRHPLGKITTPADGGSATFGGPVPGYGYVSAVDLSDLEATQDAFNARLARNGSAIAAVSIHPDGSSVDHTANDDGSVDISFEYDWSGDESEITGFEILARSSTSNSPYTPGTSDAQEFVIRVGPSKRALILQGVSATLYYTFAARGFRLVDPDINPDGVIYGAWVKPGGAGEDPYRPQSQPFFLGTIGASVGGVPATVVATTIDPATGNITSGRVVRVSLAPGSVMQTVSTTTALNVGLGGALYPDKRCVLKLNITTEGDPVHIFAEIMTNVSFIIAAQPSGTEFSAEFAVTRGTTALAINLAGSGSPTALSDYVAAGGTTIVSAFRGKVFTYNAGGAGNYRSEDAPIPIDHVDSPAAGSYTYAVWMGPGESDATANTRTRQHLKLEEFNP